MKKKLILSGLVIVSLGIAFSNKALAADENKGLGFSVSPIFNSHQIDPSKGFFYVETKPSEEQILEISVKSTQKSKVKVKVSVKDGFTNSLSAIGYTDPKNIAKEKTMKNPVSEIVKVDEESFTVANFEEKRVKVKVSPPKEGFEGVKLGALDLILDKDDKAAMGSTAGYTLGVVLATTGDEFNIAKDLKLTGVKPTIVNGQKKIVANIQNPEPFTAENLSIKAVITEKKSGKKIKQKELQGGAMAPNSNYDFGIDFGLAQIPSGDFHYHMTMKNELHEWVFDKDFTISGKDAKDVNDKSDYKITTPEWIKISAIVQIIVLIPLCTILIVRRKKMNKMLKSKKKNKKNKKSKTKKG